jgi:hypothetical protein
VPVLGGSSASEDHVDSCVRVLESGTRVSRGLAILDVVILMVLAPLVLLIMEGLSKAKTLLHGVLCTLTDWT